MSDITQADREAASKAFDIAFAGDTKGIDEAMQGLFVAHRSAAAGPMLAALANAVATIDALYQFADRVKEAKGCTSISGLATANAFFKSMETNRPRIIKLVVEPAQAAIAQAKEQSK